MIRLGAVPQWTPAKARDAQTLLQSESGTRMEQSPWTNKEYKISSRIQVLCQQELSTSMSTSKKCEQEGYVKSKNEIFTMAQQGRRRSSPV